MKFNFENKPGNKTKDQIKAEDEARKHHSAVLRHADYQNQQSKTVAPFGKTFKTEAHKSKKDYKREKPRKGKDW